MQKRFVALLVVLCSVCAAAQAVWYGDQSDPEQRAILFAHMMEGDYGRLYYAVSPDGYKWQVLNRGQRVKDDYRGHPDICRGRDSRFYLIGNNEKVSTIKIWVSEDLIDWQLKRAFVPNLSVIDHMVPPGDVSGAPKIFFDAEGDRYVITWHSSPYGREEVPGNMRWKNMRTYYITTKDFNTFSDPKRLFQFDLPTIDVILRRDGDLYYAVIKDEGIVGPTHPTGKSIRVTWAKSLDGPWCEPIDNILPNWCEAPTCIVNPNGLGWMIYAERYSAVRYELVTAPSLKGPWTYPYAGSYSLPDKAKHGGMINITRAEYDALVERYGVDEKEKANE